MATLAFAAVGLAALMPAGMIPKLAGPCGQALCECATSPAAACCLSRPEAAPRFVLEPGARQIERVTTNVAFQMVLGAADCAETLAPPVLTSAPVTPPPADFAAPPSIALDILTPPPRG
ncbi:MAG: hypothetical protein HY291_14500 [Planctomycetes bacterium]|nr:hypothetical protein [Planctomycetota bacterium]